jgi:hypothetical protein
MKLFRKIVEWFRQKYETLTAPRYKSIDINDFPTDIKPATVYIVTDGAVPDTLIFKCPCGCNADIYLNLLKDTRPNWSFHISKTRKITISPSVWRTVGCKSHFFIRRGRIDWV